LSDTAADLPAPDPASLPPYQGIRLEQVRLVRTEQEAQAALDDLLACDAIGFDTESKPTFQKGEKSTGPHLVQLSTDDICYLFQIGEQAAPHLLAVLRAVLLPAAPLKVGFGLSDDLKRLDAKLAIPAAGVLDLSVALRTPGQRHDLGAKTAVAKFFGQALQKSKKISTTNWSLPRLNDKQLLYAADDAQVALRVYRHWIASGGKVPPLRKPKPRRRRPAAAAAESPAASATVPAASAAE
jgi:RNA polymerase sigma factor for flagellar operon FliA